MNYKGFEKKLPAELVERLKTRAIRIASDRFFANVDAPEFPSDILAFIRANGDECMHDVDETYKATRTLMDFCGWTANALADALEERFWDTYEGMLFAIEQYEKCK